MTETHDGTRNEEVMRRLVDEVTNKRNAAVIDEITDPDWEPHALHYAPFTPASMEGKSPLDMMREYCERGDPNFTDTHATIDRMFSSGDTLVAVVTSTGTRGGKTISWTSVFIERFRDGRFIETWSLSDRLGMYQQLGVVPETQKLREMAGLV
jgi:predicted ester cyclase